MIPVMLENLLAIIALLGLVCLAVYLFSRPFRWLFKWVLNGICGIIVLFLLSVFGGAFGLDVPLNAVTLVISALLGLPGVVLILIKLYLF